MTAPGEGSPDGPDDGGAVLAVTPCWLPESCGLAVTPTHWGQAKQGDQKNYISGDGAVELIPPDKRSEPVVLDGTTSTAAPRQCRQPRQAAGDQCLASWCPPCQAEAPDLVAVANDPAIAAKAGFVGVNIRDLAADRRRHGQGVGLDLSLDFRPRRVECPALQGKATALPSTVVLDAQGRIAARVLGSVSVHPDRHDRGRRGGRRCP